MENAAKALTMAGGILIALMILSLLMYMFQELGEAATTQDEAKKIEQIVAFNAEYESFNRKDVYGAELISLINKMVDYNIRESDQKGYLPMNMILKFTVDEEGLFAKRTIDKVENIKSIIKQAEQIQQESEKEAKEAQKKGQTIQAQIPFSEVKRKLFKCTKIEYDETNGRITVMHFEEVNTSKPV